MAKMGSESRLKNDYLISLSMSQAAEDPQFRNTALRKVKVNEVPQKNNSVVGNNFLMSGNDSMHAELASKTNGNFLFNNHYYNSLGHYGKWEDCTCSGSGGEGYTTGKALRSSKNRHWICSSPDKFPCLESILSSYDDFSWVVITAGCLARGHAFLFFSFFFFSNVDVKCV
ncbi:Glutamate-1-semialdehyde 2,1-aminomutase [Striga asiatica]|uniref:Glutamate-1-semialdehyde 2,1-aminomutase n=1 Tax=Striga asiatica TaxID=4170 RepID=A0A5A7PCS0_STRAF|nr:Glutamate-1-semialdehyde 2,1-aminomutase [Striga asiatica]